MKYIRRVHAFGWFLLAWTASAGIAYYFQPYHNQYAGSRIVFAILMLIHIGIYWLAFSIEIKKGLLWLVLTIQAGLVLLLTQVGYDVGIAFDLSLSLLMTAVVTLKQARPILAATASYLALLFLYIHTLGSQIPQWHILWNGDPTVLQTIAPFVLVILMLYIQQERTQHAQLRKAHAQLSAYALRVEELTMLTERQRLARELHDTLVQGVVGLTMQLDVAQTQLQHKHIERAQEIVQQVIEDAHDTLMDARCALGELRGERVRPDDLVEDVQEVIAHITETTDISCKADLALLASTPAALCEHVLRMITEALTNIARHAHAQQVYIEATHCNGMLTIDVRDDGIGFDPEAVGPQLGQYGLLGIRERSRLVGGHLEITSTSGRGTQLRLRIPAPYNAPFTEFMKGKILCPTTFVS